MASRVSRREPKRQASFAFFISVDPEVPRGQPDRDSTYGMIFHSARGAPTQERLALPHARLRR